MLLLSKLIETAPLIYAGSSFNEKKNRVKYIARGVALFPLTQKWISILSYFFTASGISGCESLYQKIQRPYLHRFLSLQKRLEAASAHYRFIMGNFSREIISQIYSEKGLLLASIPTQTLGEIEVRMQYHKYWQKEGDLMIFLHQKNAFKTLFSISFSVLGDKVKGYEVFIGGIQGRESLHKELIIRMTREMHGLRPKNLLVFMVQKFCELHQIHQLVAVADHMHVCRYVRKSLKTTASYNQLWQELHALLRPDGTFLLPARFLPKSNFEINPNKRSTYRQRYKMLSKLENDFQSSLKL